MRMPLSHRPRLWDALIALVLATGVLMFISSLWWFSNPVRPTGLDTIGTIIGIIGGSGFLLTLWGSFIAPKFLYVNTKVVQISRLPAMKIAVVADFHVGPFKGIRWVRKVVKRINALKPDLILMPGDFLFDHHSSTGDLLPLRKLQSRLGIFAIMGNHDTGEYMYMDGTPFNAPDRTEDLTKALEHLGITVLRDAHQTIDVDGTTITIAGLSGQWARTIRSDDVCDGVSRPLILLSHNPDIALTHPSIQPDLIVSGHTHGGQIRFPFIGPLFVPAETGKRYAQGIFRIFEKTTLAVTHGCGESLMRARLFCRPEILLLRNENGEWRNESVFVY